MASIVHPILGSVDPAAPGSWEAIVTFGGREVEFDLTIDEPGVTARDLRDLPQRIDELVALDRAARAAILEDARSDDEDSSATLYLSHHQNVLPEVTLQRLFGTTTPGAADAEAMLSRLVLVRVGLYPESDAPVLLDYSIDPKETDYRLCVYFDSGREAAYVSMES